MNRRTTWKIVASLCLIALLLPIFSALSPVKATGSPCPLPYALEDYGQRHINTYSTATAPTLDGTKDSAYTLLDTHGQNSSPADGIYASNVNADNIAAMATEYLPKEFSVYSCYDATNLYFYFETVSRSNNSDASRYLLRVALGTKLTESSADAGTGATASGSEVAVTMNFASTTNNTKSGSSGACTYSMNTALTTQATDSTGTYDQNKTCYELVIPWSAFGSALGTPEETFDRLYFSSRFYFHGNAKNYYWYYGVSGLQNLPDGNSIVGAYTEKFGSSATYVPHVLNLSGTKPAAKYTNVPEITSLTATKNTSGHTYTAAFSVTPNGTVSERGILKADTASLLRKNLDWSNTSARNVLSSNTATFNYTVSAADNNKFITLRPYVKYSDGTIIYGEYTSMCNTYYDAVNKVYSATYNVLMIGCSFNYYYLDELIRIAEADNVKLNICNTYWSGVPARNTWNWLIHDYTNDASAEGEDVLRFVSHVDNPAGVTISNSMSTKECLEWKENLDRPEWDFISVQDHYGINESNSFEKCMEESVPYLPNIFRYLEATEPNATLLMHQTWSFQVGYTSSAGNMTSSAQQAAEHENIKKTIYTISEMMNPPKTLPGYDNFPVVPSGNAWALARANSVIGDTLCCSGAGGTTGGDNYHDGTTGGGQYLNACTWYETITGRSCVGNTFRPSEYSLSEERVAALQTAAHQAVADLYGTNYAK